jgi:hypothetical protein
VHKSVRVVFVTPTIMNVMSARSTLMTLHVFKTNTFAE